MIDVKNVVIDKKANVVMISGVDLDEIWKESKEDAPCRDVCFKFDISAPGVRKYLYLVTKNNKKANEHVHMNQRLNALVGQTMFFSNNFLVKDGA